MFTNYFFIPANKSKHLKKSQEIEGLDYRIFDFEDSILDSDIDNSIELLADIQRRDKDWIRIPLSEDLSPKIIKSTFCMGYVNFVIPKFKDLDELSLFINPILELNKNSKFILLIEHPRALVEIENILKKYSYCIHAIGLGSHDFCVETGIANNMNLLRYIRVNIMILAKAYGIEAIDVVSMNILDENSFKNDIVDGFNCGYRAKFLIHPLQLQVLKSFPFYTNEEVKKYKKILKYYENHIKGNAAVFSYEGNVYEKMHIKQFKKIVSWGEDFYGTDR